MQGRRWRRKVKEDGERSAEEKAKVGRVVHTAGRWFEHKRRRQIRTEMNFMKMKMSNESS